MRELVVTTKGKLQGNAKSLDGHDGDGADGGTDRDKDEGILCAVNRRNSVDHDSRENRNSEAVEKKPC